MPLYLAKTRSTSTSLSVSWAAPRYAGGRSDIYYTVHYSDPDNVGVLLEADCGECLTRTSCTINNLKPATNYVIQVTAHNGVSDQDEGGALARMADITEETDPPRKLLIKIPRRCLHKNRKSFNPIPTSLFLFMDHFIYYPNTYIIHYS